MNSFRILFLITSIFFVSHSKPCQAVSKLNDGWEYQWDGDKAWQKYPDVKLALSNPQKFLWLKIMLPPLDKYQVPAINIRIKTYFEVYLDKEAVYSYHKNWVLENARGGVRHLVPIPKIKGKDNYLYFKVGSRGGQVGLEGNVYLDELQNLTETIISGDETRFVLGILLCFFSVICLIVAVVTKELALLYICGFGINMGIWTLSFCHELTQSVLLGGRQWFWDPAIYWSSYLAPIFILTFIANIKNIYFKKVLYYLRNAFAVFATVVILAALLSFFTLRSANFVFNLMLIPTGIVITTATIFSALKGDRESRIVLLGIVFVGCYTLVDSLSYTYGPRMSRDIESPQGQWGMFAIFVALIVIWIERYRNVQKGLQEAKRHAAISSLTQMLAHDVRKPFSILKMGLDLFRNVKSINELKQKLDVINPEVEKAMAAVTGMINDVMEFGRTAPPKREAVSPESLIESSLDEVCRMHPEAQVKINYDFRHSHMLDVDPLKVSRVFSNILSNALQAAMNGDRIWVKTSERQGHITFCLGNSGSFIAKDDIRNIFDNFFTKNKKGGTGLGLAIAQKAILDHGGRIWCESSESEKIVEFFFTLPVRPGETSQTTARLLPGTKEIFESYERSLAVQNQIEMPSATGSVQHSLEDLSEIIANYAGEIGRKIILAIVDDEALYRNAIAELVQKNERLKDLVEVVMFSSSEQVIEALSHHVIDFIVCDVDLGKNTPNGYELVKLLREKWHAQPICIHSNRSLPEDYAQSVSAGAQAFLPKPISLFHLAKFMADIIQSSPKRPDTDSGNINSHDRTVDRVAYLDDDPVYRDFSGTLMNDVIVTTYHSPEEFIGAIEKCPKLLQDFKAIFTDQNFGRLSEKKGLDLGAVLKSKYRYGGFIIIVSNEPITDLKEAADLCIGKPIKPWAQIKKLLELKNSELPNVPLFHRKPYDQLTDAEISALSRLRHDIRGDLGSIELLFMRIESLNPVSLTKDAGLVEDYFNKVIPFLPTELSEEFRQKLRVIRGLHSESPELKVAIDDLKAAFIRIKKFHFYQDTWWATLPSTSLKQASKSQDQDGAGLDTKSVWRIAFQLKDKALESGIMAVCKGSLNAEVVATSNLTASFDAILTDDIEIMKQAVRSKTPIVFSSHRDNVDSLFKKLDTVLSALKKTT